MYSHLFHTFIRSQHMIERFLFAWAGSVKQLVDPVSGGALQALQNVYEREWPTVFVPQRCEKQMNMIRHDHDCVQMDARCENLCGRGRHNGLGRVVLSPT